MARKRKTLPDNFYSEARAGNIEEVKKILSQCDKSAHYRAIQNSNTPPEVIEWLVKECGIDINDTMAFEEAAQDRPEILGLLLSLGADMKQKQDITLRYIARYHRPKGLREMIKYGADVHTYVAVIHSQEVDTLTWALAMCSTHYIIDTAEMAEILLNESVEVTPLMKEYVTKIGTDYEFRRNSLDPQYYNIDAMDAALEKMYQLFDVPPVPHRKLYDGSEPITVQSKTWQKRYKELLDMLVPGNGSSAFVQGEVIRITGKLRYEVLHEGCAHWDSEFRKMRDALAEYLSSGKPAKEEIITKVKQVARSTQPEVFDDIIKASVRWVLQNPDPIPLGKVDYER